MNCAKPHINILYHNYNDIARKYDKKFDFYIIQLNLSEMPQVMLLMLLQ